MSQSKKSTWGGVYLEAGHGILAPSFFFVWMTRKTDITEGLGASLIF